MTKVVHRTTIIREYDYDKIFKRVSALYTTLTFAPYLRHQLEQEHILSVLAKSTDDPDTKQKHQRKVDVVGSIHNMLYYQQHRMYDAKQYNWHMEEDTDGYVWIWSRANTPKSILGLATFEYHYG